MTQCTEEIEQTVGTSRDETSAPEGVTQSFPPLPLARLREMQAASQALIAEARRMEIATQAFANGVLVALGIDTQLLDVVVDAAGGTYTITARPTQAQALADPA